MNSPNQGAAPSTNTPSPANPASSSTGNSNIPILLILGGLVVVVIIVVVLISSSGGTTPSAVMQNHSENTTPIYMSVSQAQNLLGAPVSNYYTSDLFNPNAEINITDLEYFAPSLSGNVTSGWISSASIYNGTYNVSLQYYVLRTGNAVAITQELSSNITSSFNMTPSVVTPGQYDGLTYSYSLYENSSTSVQVLTGYKNNNIVLEILESSPPYIANVTQFVDIAANDTP